MNKPSRDYGRVADQDRDDVTGHVHRPEVAIETGDDVEGHRYLVTDEGTDDVAGHVQPRGDLDMER